MKISMKFVMNLLSEFYELEFVPDEKSHWYSALNLELIFCPFEF